MYGDDNAISRRIRGFENYQQGLLLKYHILLILLPHESPHMLEFDSNIELLVMSVEAFVYIIKQQLS